LDNKRIIVPLDFPDADAALALAARLDSKLCRVKVGKELFVAAGPAVVARLQERGFEVFLDLKFHDIPNTVAGACRAAARLGVWMMNVHASGGEAMLRAAREAIEGVARPPLLIAVTILTSLTEKDQARVVTPPEAVRLGAHYLVIGRPITQSPDPAGTLAAIRESIEEGAAA
jgi:orotidine-5'-phosphate decarboxylase